MIFIVTCPCLKFVLCTLLKKSDGMAELGPFPIVDEVLNKLKSNGTFDQYRKTCLESIEAEVSCIFCLLCVVPH